MNFTASLRAISIVLALISLSLSIGCQRRVNQDPPPSDALSLPVANHNVLTFHNDNGRTGQYLTETVLQPAALSAASFGKVAFLPVQGLVDAQPLFVSHLSIGGVARNVIFVVTEHDLAYAFDADSHAVLWKTSVLAPGETPSDDVMCGQITPEIGITATPVIDLQSGPHGTMFLVAMSKDVHKRYLQRLHALDITTGAELTPPQTIQATAPGSGAGSQNGMVSFDAAQYEERAALLAVNGVIYTTWSSHCDHDPYTGWVIAFNESNLLQAAVLDLTANGNEGATWMAGDGPAADAAGNVYLLTGNGTFDTSLDSNGFPDHGDFGNAFVKLSLNEGRLSVADYFTMHDTIAESNKDEDLGSGGITLLPDMKDSAGRVRHLAIGAGKDSNIYLADRDSLGKFDLQNDRVYQLLRGVLKAGQFATPAYFHNVVYYGGVRDHLKAFPIASACLSSSPSSQTAASFNYPGVTPVISANGESNAIVWAVESDGEAGEADDTRAILHAYSASDLSKELYNSAQSGSRDMFIDNKFIAPMVADGKVYVGTPTGVVVFGMLPKSK